VRIAVLTSRDWVNSNYRAFPLVALQARGHDVRLELDGDRARTDGLQRFDVIYVYRLTSAPIRKLLEQLRKLGKAIVWDDDDFVATPELDAGGPRSQQGRLATTRMLKLAHIVTTPSAALADHFRAWGGDDVRVLENYLPGAYAPPPRREHEHVTIGWTAAAEHVHDLETLRLDETFRRLLDAHPTVRFASLGVNLRLPPERYDHLYRVQYYELAEQVAQWDIGIAPIVDVPFNRTRSNVKLKEYAAAGTPWLASPMGPYVGLGEQQGGRLVPDDGWYAALDRLIVKARERRKLAKRGRKWAATQTVDANLDAYERVLSEALARAAA
jgi:glycosyltransferase involved in cell wall biosynthesis